MKRLFFLLIIGFSLLAAYPSQAGSKPTVTPSEKPAFFVTLESIARGLTFRSVDAKNVSVTLAPTRAYLRIVF